jgi:hypothetical protein
MRGVFGYCVSTSYAKSLASLFAGGFAGNQVYTCVAGNQLYSFTALQLYGFTALQLYGFAQKVFPFPSHWEGTEGRAWNERQRGLFVGGVNKHINFNNRT